VGGGSGESSPKIGHACPKRLFLAPPAHTHHKRLASRSVNILGRFISVSKPLANQFVRVAGVC
jgi:hypothetical protein